jgi:two-component system OmpR family response regulator
LKGRREGWGRMAARIVVADDDPDIAEIFAQILEGENFTVECAANGAQALALVERERPALVLADLVMPEMDGAALARRVAALPGAPIPFLLTSASRPLHTPPGVAFLPKPFELDELVTMVRCLLGRS